ncbi:MAG: hypothetical protein RLZZ450_6029 [Pseudomonadota bacterium]|jgi:hypothetical protein
MATNVRFALAFVLSLGILACSDDEEKDPVATPVVDSGVPSVPTPTADSGPTTTVPETDAGTTVSKAIPLIDWVDDLVDHHTDDTSPPDTVDDKNIADNEDPTTFDRRF